MDYSEERTEEDHIIETLIVNGNKKLYEDLDFLPTRQSLYNTEKYIPEYDDEIGQRIMWCRPHEIDEGAVYFDSKNRHIGAIQGSLPDDVFLGALMAVCVYSKYDLIENLFASKPEDFMKYGVYTCRFYVDGEWVNVITDTMLPCERNNTSSEISPVYARSIGKNEMWISLIQKSFAKAMGNYESISQIKLQRALLHLTGGSIQQSSLRDEILRNDSLGDLIAWQEFRKRLQQDCLVLLLPEEWKKPSMYSSTSTHGNDPPIGSDGNHNPVDESQKAENFFIPNHAYSVITCRDVGGYELVLMHNPYQHPAYQWNGEWSDNSNDWDLYPELLVEIEKDPAIPWKRKQSNGYFWISFRTMMKHFNKMFVCLLFPNDAYRFYCLRGECRGRKNGGPLVTLRDKDAVWKEYHRYHQLAGTSTKVSSIQAVIDGDAAWFNNPQYRIHLPPTFHHASSSHSSGRHCHHHQSMLTDGQEHSNNNDAMLYVSVVPLGNGEAGSQDQADISLDIVTTPKHLPHTTTVPINLWEITQCETIVNDRHNTFQISTKGQETSLWAIPMDSKHYYYVVPNTVRRDRDGDFMLRIFSTTKLLVETIPMINCTSLQGEWKRVGDMDTTGGPMTIPPQPTHLLFSNPAHDTNTTAAVGSASTKVVPSNPDDPPVVGVVLSNTGVLLNNGSSRHHHHPIKENSKWSQNPQYHIQLNQLYGNTDEVYLKIVLRKHDSSHHTKLHKQKTGGTGGSSNNNNNANSANNNADEKKANATIGLTVTKADVYEENPSKSKKKVPRQNKLGELVPTKESSLRPRKSSSSQIPPPPPTNTQAEPKLILRKLHVHNDEYNLVTSYENKQESCVFYPRLPRSWFPNGLLVIPSLSEKGVRSKFDLEVYCSEALTVTQLPETFARSIAGEWSEHTAGGSHIFPSSWKKNPKFLLHLHFPLGHHSSATGQVDPARVRITLARHGNNWKSNVKKDTVGCMIGFYIFIGRGHSGTSNTIGDMVQYFEATFVAGDECITDLGYTLPQLHPDEYYVIMPTTFSEGKHGSFVISVMSEVEFQLVKES